MHFAMVAKLWGCDGRCCMLCVFLQHLQSQWHLGNQIIVLPPRPPGAIKVSKNFHHLGGSISVEGSSAKEFGGAVLESTGTAADICGDCSLLDTLLGSGTKLVEFPKFASGILADFRQPSRSALQPQVRSTSRNTSLSPVETLR